MRQWQVITCDYTVLRNFDTDNEKPVLKTAQSFYYHFPTLNQDNVELSLFGTNPTQEVGLWMKPKKLQ